MTYIKFEWIMNVCWILFIAGDICLVFLCFRFLVVDKQRKYLASEIEQAQEYYKPYYEKMRLFLCELNKQREKFGELKRSFQIFSKKYLKSIEKSDYYEKLVEKIKEFGITETITETKGLREKGIFSKRRNRKVFRKEFDLKKEIFYDPQYTNEKYLFLNLTKNDFIMFSRSLAFVIVGIFILLNVFSSQFPPYFKKYYWKLLIACIIVIGGGLCIYFQEIFEPILIAIICAVALSVLILMVIYIWHEYEFMFSVLKIFFNFKFLCLTVWDVGVIVCLIPNALHTIKIISFRVTDSKNHLNTLRCEEKRNNLKDMLDDELLEWIDFIKDNLNNVERKMKRYIQPAYKKKLVGEELKEVAQIYLDYMLLKIILEQEVADDFETGLKKIDSMIKDVQKYGRIDE